MSMFSFGLILRSVEKYDFDALDTRRRLGLEDGVVLRIAGHIRADQDVSEGFARTWFGKSTTDNAYIELDWLTKGEVEQDKYGFVLRLSEERAKDLYIRSKFEAAVPDKQWGHFFP